jgi:outer membrane protein OmpA-like peptidoglycan-associated protein
MLRTFSAVSVAALVVAGSTACATKNYVRNDIKPVNDKVDTLGRSVEETQERTRKNEGAIGDVDKKAQAAQSSADSARQAAGDADAEAKAARARANEVGSKADDFDRSQRRLVYTVVLSEDEGQFKSGKAVLPDDAKVKLDELVTKLKADPSGAFFEI